MAILELQDIFVEYRRPGRMPVQAVAGVSLSVERGQIVALVGETGCGKSTVAKAAVGLIPLEKGSIWFEGKEIHPLTRGARARDEARLQLVFQNPFSSLNPRRKIGEQIADALEILNLVPRSRRPQRVRELLEMVGLPSTTDRFPYQFSGGQRQRIAIARALAADPSAIVMDEPLSGLDASAQAQIANLLRRLSHQQDIGLLLIAHDLSMVRQIADVVVVMYLGLVVEVGSTAELWSNARHPYTQALINSIPLIDGAGVLPKGLAGEVPDPASPPLGCRFHPRCPVAFDRCAKETPPLIELAANRRAACWLVDQTEAIPDVSATPVQ